MLMTFGFLCIALGLLGFVGQLISTVNYPLAQRLGLQERDDHTEPLYRRLERHTAVWDLFINWTLPLAGMFMLMAHPWWPYLALVTGGVHLDTGGREISKLLALRAEGVKSGDHKERRTAIGFLAFLSIVGLLVIGLAAAFLLGAEFLGGGR